MKFTPSAVMLACVFFSAQTGLCQRYPAIAESERIQRLAPPKQRPVRMVLDTDTYNEIDDQFAVVYALISPELDVQAIYAAPFHNSRSSGPGDGMEKSYEEILRVLSRWIGRPTALLFKGSTRLPDRSGSAGTQSRRPGPDRTCPAEQPGGPAVCRRRRRDHQRQQRDPDRPLDHPQHRRGLAGRQRAPVAASTGVQFPAGSATRRA